MLKANHKKVQRTATNQHCCKAFRLRNANTEYINEYLFINSKRKSNRKKDNLERTFQSSNLLALQHRRGKRDCACKYKI